MYQTMVNMDLSFHQASYQQCMHITIWSQSVEKHTKQRRCFDELTYVGQAGQQEAAGCDPQGAAQAP